MKKNIIEDLVVKCTTQILNEDNNGSIKSVTPSTKLYGQGGNLDSLELVRLVALIEEHLLDEHNIEITIASEKAMSRRNSPFESVSSLVEFIVELQN
jgi:acyl carrier protein